MAVDYILIRSNRKTLALEVKPDLTVIVRAPLKMPKKQIEKFLEKHRDWLLRALERTATRKERNEATDLREDELKHAAKTYLPQRTAEWAKIMNLSPAGVKITSAKTRFGSCSGTNHICYSWRLMAYPQAAVDYVIVHELAHILQKNHSSKFYAIIETYLPDWKERQSLLRK